eukprot:SAG31_NODE_148_length_22511_cov_20.369266_19_plen_140_part_00
MYLLPASLSLTDLLPADLTLGAIATVWFDGGTGLGAATVDKMVALREKLQPQAVTFGGCAAMPVNSVAWVGTESGHAPYPLWYARDVCGTAATGSAMGRKIYTPYEVDCTLQVRPPVLAAACFLHLKWIHLATKGFLIV